MEEIICLSACIVFIIVLKFVLKINYKKAKVLEDNKELQKITDRFPENIKIAEEMLELLNNKNVKIEEQKNTKTSLYVVITNKILISDLKDNYGRIGTIAHECMHSIQDRSLLMFNFFYSNLVLIYWIVSLILIICNVFSNIQLLSFILLLLLFIQTLIRLYLEIDAMLKSLNLSNEYVKRKKMCLDKEREELINEYKIINDMGIRFYIFKLTTNSFIKVLLIVLFSYIT